MSDKRELTSLESIIVNIIIYTAVVLCYKYFFGAFIHITLRQSLAIVGLILVTRLVWSRND